MKNPLSVEAFADWCEKQPANRPYNFYDTDRCACAQYSDDCGLGWGNSSGKDFWCDANRWAAAKPHTFGALAARLRSVASSPAILSNRTKD